MGRAQEIKISDAEMEIMEVIWDYGQTVTFGMIMAGLDKKRKWTNSTAHTLLQRLVNKGAVKCEKGFGKAFHYTAILEAKPYKFKVAKNMMNRFYNGSMSAFLAEWVDDHGISDEDAEAMRRILNEQLEDKE